DRRWAPAAASSPRAPGTRGCRRTRAALHGLAKQGPRGRGTRSEFGCAKGFDEAWLGHSFRGAGASVLLRPEARSSQELRMAFEQGSGRDAGIAKDAAARKQGLCQEAPRARRSAKHRAKARWPRLRGADGRKPMVCVWRPGLEAEVSRTDAART